MKEHLERLLTAGVRFADWIVDKEYQSISYTVMALFFAAVFPLVCRLIRIPITVDVAFACIIVALVAPLAVWVLLIISPVAIPVLLVIGVVFVTSFWRPPHG